MSDRKVNFEDYKAVPFSDSWTSSDKGVIHSTFYKTPNGSCVCVEHLADSVDVLYYPPGSWKPASVGIRVVG